MFTALHSASRVLYTEQRALKLLSLGGAVVYGYAVDISAMCVYLIYIYNIHNE